MVINRRILVIIGLILIAVFSLAAVSKVLVSVVNTSEPVLRLGLTGSVASIDPALIINPSGKMMASAVYEPLLFYDFKSHSLKPRLAQSWEYSKDGKSVVFILSGDVYFHDGRRLRAEDVKKSWERALKLSSNSQIKNLFLSIEGCDSFLQGTSHEIDGIRVEKENTLRVRFITPDSAFVYKITNPAFWVVSDSVVGLPSGTGPYRISIFNPGQTILLERFKNYHGIRPSIGRLSFTCFSDEYQGLAAFRAGKLDYLESVPLKELKNLESEANMKKSLFRTQITGFYALAMNVNHPPFNDPALRRAVNYCIDRNALINSVMAGAGTAAKGPVPSGLHGYNRSMQGYAWDLEKARQMMADSDYFKNVNTPAIKLTYNDNPGHQRLAEALKSQLEAIGIKVELAAISWKTFEEQVISMKLDFFRFGWEADYPDPDDFLYSLFHSGRIGAGNYTGYKNPQADRVLEAARSETRSENERIKLLQRAEAIIVDDAPMVWLFQKENVGLIDPKVQGFEIDGMRMVNWTAISIQAETDA